MAEHVLGGPADVDAILAVEAGYDVAWCGGDLDELIRCFADDAVLINPRGEAAVGTGEIRARLGAFLQGEARGSRHASRVTRVSFLTPDVAIVDGEATISNAAAFGSLEHRFTDIFIRGDQRWLIAHVRAYAFA